MVVKPALCVALLLALASPAHALCRDDLKELKPRIDTAKRTSPQRYYLALTWWGRAQEAEAGSEVECLNYLAKAKKALFDPLIEIAGCDGPNAYLPNCRNGGGQGAGFGGPVQAFGVGGGGGGGGGAPFHPPGSPATPGGGEATGTDR